MVRGDTLNTGENIKKYRKEKKVTQKQLAEKIGKNIRTVQKYESGEIEVPLESLFKISEALDIPLKSITQIDNNYIDNLPNNNAGNLIKSVCNNLNISEYSNPDEVRKIINTSIDKYLDENVSNHKRIKKYISLFDKIQEIDNIFNYLEQTSSKLKSLNLSKSDFQSLMLLEKIWTSAKNEYLNEAQNPNLFYTEGYVTCYLDSIKFLKSSLEELESDYL